MRTILAAIDFSDATDDVIQTAKQLAQAFNARILLLHTMALEEADYIAYDMGPAILSPPPEDSTEHVEVLNKRLDMYAERLSMAGIDTTPLLTDGSPAKQIVRHAEDAEADMIILGSHGHGALYHLLVGSVASHVLKHAHVPVTLVPGVKHAETSEQNKAATGMMGM